MRDHDIGVVALAAALALVLLRTMGPEVHRGRVVPKEEWLAFLVSLVDECERVFGHFLVDGFHPLFGEWTGILDLLSAFAICPAVEHASRSEMLLERRIFWVVHVLRLLLRVEMVEIAEEFVEAVHRGQEFILVAEMVLAELAGDIAEGLQQFRNGGVIRPDADIGTWHANLGQPGTDRVLAGDERCAPRGAALLAVVVREGCTFMAEAIDIRGSVAHLPTTIVADIPPPN